MMQKVKLPPQSIPSYDAFAAFILLPHRRIKICILHLSPFPSPLYCFFSCRLLTGSLSPPTASLSLPTGFERRTPFSEGTPTVTRRRRSAVEQGGRRGKKNVAPVCGVEMWGLVLMAACEVVAALTS